MYEIYRFNFILYHLQIKYDWIHMVGQKLEILGAVKLHKWFYPWSDYKSVVQWDVWQDVLGVLIQIMLECWSVTIIFTTSKFTKFEYPYKDTQHFCESPEEGFVYNIGLAW